MYRIYSVFRNASSALLNSVGFFFATKCVPGMSVNFAFGRCSGRQAIGSVCRKQPAVESEPIIILSLLYICHHTKYFHYTIQNYPGQEKVHRSFTLRWTCDFRYNPELPINLMVKDYSSVNRLRYCLLIGQFCFY